MEFFTDGTDAIRSMTNTLGGDTGLLATELKKVRLQDEFDVIETDWEEDQEFYDRLWEVDCEQQEMATAANGWLIDRLNFISKPVNGYQDKVIRYKYRCPGNGPCTLVPVDELIKRFRPVIDINHSRFDPNNPCTFPLTYQRQTARSRGVRLARIGDSFIEAMHKHIRQDDRGVSFAMWRHIPNLKIEGKFWLAFRFDFVVEADLYPAQEFLEGQKTFHHDSLRRRMDALFPPFPRTLWLNEELQQITNPKALEMLSKPYSQKRNKDGYRDFNLNPVRWGNIESIIDHASWHSLCQASHDQAKVLLLNDQSTQEYIEVRLARAKHSIAVRLEQLQSRLDHQGERAET
jgi:ATP-dependent helicase HepA